jgi:uroporphyrinogen-III synthase
MLDKKRILVTRPRHQAARLCELISANGGKAISYPSIEIQAVDDQDSLLKNKEALSEYVLVIFVSRNAVKIVFENYIDTNTLPKDVQFVAIGAGTADALSELGITNLIHAGVQADSETLLQLPELQSKSVTGKKILIVRGIGGREYLADNLQSRGAEVTYAEVYKRCLPEYDAQDGHTIWQEIKPDAIIISSNDGLINLVSLTADTDQVQLFSTPLVLMSVRSVNLAKELGFTSAMSIAKDKNDEGLLSALLDLMGE